MSGKIREQHKLFWFRMAGGESDYPSHASGNNLKYPTRCFCFPKGLLCVLLLKEAQPPVLFMFPSWQCPASCLLSLSLSPHLGTPLCLHAELSDTPRRACPKHAHVEQNEGSSSFNALEGRGRTTFADLNITLGFRSAPSPLIFHPSDFYCPDMPRHSAVHKRNSCRR